MQERDTCTNLKDISDDDNKDEPNEDECENNDGEDDDQNDDKNDDKEDNVDVELHVDEGLYKNEKNKKQIKTNRKMITNMAKKKKNKC